MIKRFTTVREYKDASYAHLKKRLNDAYKNINNDIRLPEKREKWIRDYDHIMQTVNPKAPIDLLNVDIKRMMTILADDVEEWARFGKTVNNVDDIIVASLMTVEYDISIIPFTYIFTSIKLSEDLIEELVFITSGVLFDKHGIDGVGYSKRTGYHFDIWDDEHVRCVNDCLAISPSEHNNNPEFRRLFPGRVTEQTMSRKYLQKYMKSAYVDKKGKLWFSITTEDDYFGPEDIELGNVKNINPLKIKCLPFDDQVGGFSSSGFHANLEEIAQDGSAKKFYDAYLKYVIEKESYAECTAKDILIMMAGRSDWVGRKFMYDTYKKDWYLVERRHDHHAHELCTIPNINSVHRVTKINIDDYTCKEKSLKPYSYWTDKVKSLPDRVNWYDVRRNQKLSIAFINRHAKQMSYGGSAAS